MKIHKIKLLRGTSIYSSKLTTGYVPKKHWKLTLHDPGNTIIITTEFTTAKRAFRRQVDFKKRYIYTVKSVYTETEQNSGVCSSTNGIETIAVNEPSQAKRTTTTNISLIHGNDNDYKHLTHLWK